jgi:hypothetical protein
VVYLRSAAAGFALNTMKLTFVALFLCHVTLICDGAVVNARRSTPVSRVVQLLQQLQEKLDADMKAESKIFQKYECWFKTIKEAKTASNSAAGSRISTLETYIADIEAGRIEFTTERKDLEKQVAELTSDLKTAASLRAKENKDYQAAKVELQQGLTALTEAIRILEEGTSMLLARKTGVQRLSERWSLRKALTFGQAVLSKDDALLLEKIFESQTPTPDWKKLNRDATFKKKYTARSGDISATLKKLQTTFAGNLNEVETKESAAQASYDNLKSSKEAMLESSQAALLALVEENGARGLSKSEANEEVTALQAQVAADTNFIDQVQGAFDAKEKEYQARVALRQRELSAITEAIAVLHSDDARDKFKESFKSQGYSFLQDSSKHSRRSVLYPVKLGGRSSAAKAAQTMLLSTSTAAGGGSNSRVAVLAKLTRSMSIDQVIAAVDGLLTELAAEEQEDLAKKESCESQLADSTKNAQTMSRAIDGLTDDMTRLASKVAELEEEIVEQEKAISAANASIAELDDQRAAEEKQFTSDQAADSEAIMVVEKAMNVLTTMMTEVHGATSLTQRRKLMKRQPYEVVAGEAPPPPPTTWENPTYEGAQESPGIISLLTVIKEDMEKDVELAAAAEKAAVEAYVKAKGELQQAMSAAQDAITGYEEEKAQTEETSLDKGTEKTGKKKELGTIMSMIDSLRPGCDFILVNIDIRTKKRHIEVDGLNKAKAILQGATFS